MHVVSLLHGADGRVWTLWPLLWALMLWAWVRHTILGRPGSTHILCVPYDNKGTLETAIASAKRSLELRVNLRGNRVTLVGQSLGGNVALALSHALPEVTKVVTIASPLRGARILRTLKTFAPSFLLQCIKRPVYDEIGGTRFRLLIAREGVEVVSVSTGWPLLTFDGCVHIDEACYDLKSHWHIPCSDHRLIFVDLRLLALTCALVAPR